MPAIVLVRHAQASFGTADYDVLSDAGHAQVTALVDGLERRGVRADRVVAGALRRQRDTAGPCAERAGVDVLVDERWNEYTDIDVLTHHSDARASLETPGLDSRQFQAILDEGLRSWVRAGADSRCDESWPAFHTRVTGALDDVAAGLGKGETALVVSSGGVISAVAASLLGLPAESFIAFNHVSINTGITKLVVGRGGTSLISYNEHAHLEEAGDVLLTYR